MLSDLLWTAIMLIFFTIGIRHSYVALCGVIWVDVLKPQDLSFGFLLGQPLSLISTAIFGLSLLLNIRSISIPKKKNAVILMVLFMAWITYTSVHAQFQAAAWYKHDFVFKTILFAVFIPLAINNRVKLDTFIAIMVSAIGFYTMIGGMRTILGSSQYGTQLVYTHSGDSGIGETSTLSMVSVFCIPFLYYLYKHSIFKDRIVGFKFLIFCLGFSCVVTTIGTHARTGLVGLAVLGFLAFWSSKHKFRLLAGGLVLALAAIPFAPDGWIERMSTINDSSEDASAFGRIVVWRWTIDYVKDRPFRGGGFQSYRANRGELHKYIQGGEIEIDHKSDGKAFHNILFEVLGEQGYVGLALYMMMIMSCWLLSRSVIKLSTDSDWSAGLGRSIIFALLIYGACGMFIGVAYAPWPFYFLALACCLHNAVSIGTKNKQTTYPAQ